MINTSDDGNFDVTRNRSGVFVVRERCKYGRYLHLTDDGALEVWEKLGRALGLLEE